MFEGQGIFEISNIVYIFSINSLQVNCSISESSYLNNERYVSYISFFLMYLRVIELLKIVNHKKKTVDVYPVDKIRIWKTN